MYWIFIMEDVCSVMWQKWYCEILRLKGVNWCFTPHQHLSGLLGAAERNIQTYPSAAGSNVFLMASQKLSEPKNVAAHGLV